MRTTDYDGGLVVSSEPLRNDETLQVLLLLLLALSRCLFSSRWLLCCWKIVCEMVQ